MVLEVFGVFFFFFHIYFFFWETDKYQRDLGLFVCLFSPGADFSARSLPSTVLYQYSVPLPGLPQQPYQSRHVFVPFGEIL